MDKISSEEAELIGMHVGDGTLYKSGKSVVWELRGDLKEKDYYKVHVSKILKSIFNKDFIPKFRCGGKNGCFGFQTCDKQLTTFFLSHAFEAKSKVKTVRVPDCVNNSTNKVKFSIVRGYFDTDGCLRFDRNKGKRHTYPKIEFSSASEYLIKDLSNMLRDLGFINYVWSDRGSLKLCVSGKKMLEKWHKRIKPKNPKYLNKYAQFQEFGYVVPYAEVAQSGTART